jgi:hypothetical protein
MLEEGLHGVLHFDSKMWRTLPLLAARPGLLTRRYIDGQRVRYVSPLALFLFTIFLMFFVLSFVGGAGKPGTPATAAERAESRAELVAEVDEAKAEVAKYSAAFKAAKEADERADASSELEAANIDLRTAQFVLSTFDKASAVPQNPGKTAEVVTREDLTALTGKAINLDIKTPGALKHLAENPELMLYKLKNTAYKFSFMLIPISLPFLWMMFFWKRDVTTYDHMVFSMYSLSFMSLLFVIVVLLGMTSFTSRFIAYFAWLPPLHMFLQLKETYRLKFFSAFWRTFALLISAGTVFVLFFILVLAIIMT